MKHNKRVAEACGRVCLVLVLAVSLPAFADFARAADTERSTKAEVGARQESSDNGVKAPAANDNAVPAAAAQDAPALKSRKEKLSYALGMSLGKQFRDQSIEVAPDVYLQGLKDALSGGKTLLTDKEARAVVNALQGELKKKQAALKAPGAPTGIAVSFKMDPRITKGLYMGDRWISPPTYTSTLQEGKEITVEARAEGRDAKGRTMKIKPEWKPSDPGMVAVTPGHGDEVKITVKRDGQSKMKVASSGYSKELSIKATYQDNAIRVEITQ